MKLFSFLLIGGFAFAACSGSKKSESSAPDALMPDEANHRLAIDVDVDGSLKEWPEPLPGYSKETALHFGLTNNKDFLFIAVASSEDRVQQKLLQPGMEVYISVNGKKEKTTGITFPQPSTKNIRQPKRTGEFEGAATTKNSYKKRSNEELSHVYIFGFKNIPDSAYPLSNSTNMKVAYSWSDNNFFNIEYAIPLKELFSTANAANANNIQVGFKLNGFDGKANDRQGGSYAGGSRGGGMRGGGGGGMRGGGMRQINDGYQGVNNMSDFAKEQSFWTKYSLSSASK